MTQRSQPPGNLRIDGQLVELQPGDTLLQAARAAGLDKRIPTLCYRQGSAPDGGCGLCLVQVTEKGGQANAATVVRACTTPAQAGMDVLTQTAEITAIRRTTLQLMFTELAPQSATRLRGGGHLAEDFWQWLREYDAWPEDLPADTKAACNTDNAHPYLRFDPDLCITCRRCLHTCEDLQGQFVFGIGDRGPDTHLLIGPHDSFAGSDCVACGACVEECPTGALFDVDRMPGSERSAELRAVRSTCGYCGVGCGVEVMVADDRIVRIDGAADSPVNHGHLCAKGRYAHGFQSSADRLTTPLLRRAGRLVPVSWAEAITWLADRLQTIRDTAGPDALGAMTSSRSTNEANYLLQKLFRTRIGTNNVDNCARVCHASTALALSKVTGTGAASASYADIELARCIVVAGANPTEAHPVVGARIKQAVRRGARLIVIDPRRIELAEWADLHLAPRPGTNVALFNALAGMLLDEQLLDNDYLAARVDGLAELQSFLARQDYATAGATCGVSAEAIRAAARLIGTEAPTLFVTGLGLSELTQGTASVMTLCNLAMLTGSVGRPGGGMLPLRGQNNVQGNADMGALPDLFTGYQSIHAPEVREHVRAFWGALPPENPGLTIPEMIDAAADGRVRALWIQGEDVAQSDPNTTHVRNALARLELLVVQELFMTDTAACAHLVLPSAAALEQDGTFTNGERRIQRVRQAVPPPGNARADWSVVQDVANAMGATWDYPDPSAVMDEIARAAPKLFGGIRYARLGNAGLQWPCPTPEHPGTATVHADRFIRGRGQLVALDYVPSPEQCTGDFPLLLITGRVLQHYNVGTMTRRTPNAELVSADFLEINPGDAEVCGVSTGSRVQVSSRYGSIEVEALVSQRVTPGMLFLSFHFPESQTNVLTGPYRDPQSKCPEYKLTAVRITAVGQKVSFAPVADR
jgi:formate dehydrogenase alpha subunit